LVKLTVANAQSIVAALLAVIARTAPIAVHTLLTPSAVTAAAVQATAIGAAAALADLPMIRDIQIMVDVANQLQCLA